MSGERLTVCVVDDQASVAAGLESLLRVAGYEVLTFPSAKRFLEEAGKIPAGSVVLTDICMPDLDGIELMNQLGGTASPFPLIIMTGHASVRVAISAMRAGAVDFVEKPFTRGELLAALDRARRRAGPMVPAAPADLMRRHNSLSPREREVLHLMVGGETSKIIARRLGISPRTVEVHRSNVLQKMDARNVADLIHKTLRLGIRPAV